MGVAVECVANLDTYKSPLRERDAVERGGEGSGIHTDCSVSVFLFVQLICIQTYCKLQTYNCCSVQTNCTR